MENEQQSCFLLRTAPFDTLYLLVIAFAFYKLLIIDSIQ